MTILPSTCRLKKVKSVFLFISLIIAISISSLSISISTINEIRAEENLEPLEFGDVILNPQYIQWVQFKLGQQQQQNQQMNNEIDQGNEGFEDTQKSVYKALNKDNIFQILINEYLNKIENV